ncbi:hypothetical protein ISS30_09570 [bacterium]|nr:hypothetical protein [bacterium]
MKLLKNFKFKDFKYYRIRLNMLLFAVFLWLFVVTGREYEDIIPIPVEVVNFKKGKIIVNDIPSRVRVRFRGDGRSLIGMQLFKKSILELDLATINYFYDYPLHIEMVKSTSGNKVSPVEIIEPDTIRIVLDEVYETVLPVIPNVMITPAAGLAKTGATTVHPDSVRVTGPFQELNKLLYISTVRKEFIDVKRSIREKIPLLLPHGKMNSSVEEVTIEAEIQKLTEILFRNIPVELLNPPPHLEVILEPSSVVVKICGPLSVLKDISAEQVKAVTNIPNMNLENLSGLPVTIELPDNVELISVTPETLAVTFIEK